MLTLPLTMLGGGRIEWQGAVGSGITVLPAGNIDAPAKLALLDRFQPKALYGSTSYFGHLLAIAERTPPCPSVEVPADRPRGRRLLATSSSCSRDGMR